MSRLPPGIRSCCSTRGDASREQAYIEFLTQQAYADGVLYISPRATPEQVMALARDEMPPVLCNYMVDVESVPCLLVDHVSSMYQTTAHLLSSTPPDRVAESVRAALLPGADALRWVRARA